MDLKEERLRETTKIREIITEIDKIMADHDHGHYHDHDHHGGEKTDRSQSDNIQDAVKPRPKDQFTTSFTNSVYEDEMMTEISRGSSVVSGAESLNITATKSKKRTKNSAKDQSKLA